MVLCFSVTMRHENGQITSVSDPAAKYYDLHYILKGAQKLLFQFFLMINTKSLVKAVQEMYKLID